MIPTEAQEGEILVAYLRLKNLKFTHIPNETGGSAEAKRRAVRMKRQGVSRGFVDYLIIVNDKLIAIELKRRRGSVVSPEQKAWVEALNQIPNVEAYIAYGADQVIKIIQSAGTRNQSSLLIFTHDYPFCSTNKRSGL